jgi:hypothetical protein
MSIWGVTANALAALSIPAAADRFVVATGAALPDQFLVYQLITSPNELNADNREVARSYRMQVTGWSRSGPATLPDVGAAMEAAGFSRGAVRSLAYSEGTRHYGLAMDFVYAGDLPALLDEE